MRPPTIAPGIESKPPRISTGSAFSATKVSANWTPLRAPQSKPGDQRDRAGHAPHDRPDLLQRNADGQCRLVIVGHGAQRAPDPRAAEEQRQHRHQDRRHARRHEVELRHVHSGRVGQPLHRLVLQAELEAAHVGAPHDLRQALDEEREADRRHEQRDLRLVDERAQHDALGHESQHDHHRERRRYRQPRGKAVLQQSDVGERGEEHHRTLREVEHAGRLVDQHEAQRHERIHHAREQAADQNLEEE